MFDILRREHSKERERAVQSILTAIRKESKSPMRQVQKELKEHCEMTRPNNWVEKERKRTESTDRRQKQKGETSYYAKRRLEGGQHSEAHDDHGEKVVVVFEPEKKGTELNSQQRKQSSKSILPYDVPTTIVGEEAARRQRGSVERLSQPRVPKAGQQRSVSVPTKILTPTEAKRVAVTRNWAATASAHDREKEIESIRRQVSELVKKASFLGPALGGRPSLELGWRLLLEHTIRREKRHVVHGDGIHEASPVPEGKGHMLIPCLNCEQKLPMDKLETHMKVCPVRLRREANVALDERNGTTLFHQVSPRRFLALIRERDELHLQCDGLMKENERLHKFLFKAGLETVYAQDAVLLHDPCVVGGHNPIRRVAPSNMQTQSSLALPVKEDNCVDYAVLQEIAQVGLKEPKRSIESILQERCQNFAMVGSAIASSKESEGIRHEGSNRGKLSIVDDVSKQIHGWQEQKTLSPEELQLFMSEMEEELVNLRKSLAVSEDENVKLKESLDRLDATGPTDRKRDMQDKESNELRMKELLHREKINELEADIIKQRDINIALRKSLAESEDENIKLKESLDRLDAAGPTKYQCTIDTAELLCRTVVAEVVRAERDELAARVARLEVQLSGDRREEGKQQE